MDRSLTAVRLGVRMRGERLGAWTLARLGDPLAELTQPAGQRNPYPVYERIRARGPVSRSRTGMWVTCSHALVVEAVRDRRFRVRDGADRVGSGLGELDPGLDDSLVDMEPPEHTRLRRLAAPAFARGRIQAYRGRVETLLDGLLDTAAKDSPDGQFDLINAVASPLPVAVIADLLGIPDADAPRFAHYGRQVGGFLDGVRSVAQARELRQAVTEMRELLSGVVRAHEQEPADDLIGALLSNEQDRLSTTEIVALGIQLLIAGFETTTQLIGNGMAALLADPAQWEALVADPGLAPAVVEETLRYDPPVQLTQRIAREDMEVAGHQLAAGEQLIVGLAGANRDPDVFTDPQRFDIHRKNSGEHLGFSGGHHFCIGAPLARLEGELAFAALASRLPKLRPAGQPQQRESTVLRGVLRLPVNAN